MDILDKERKMHFECNYKFFDGEEEICNIFESKSKND